MGLLSVNFWGAKIMGVSETHLLLRSSLSGSKNKLPIRICCGFRSDVRAFARRKNSRRNEEVRKNSNLKIGGNEADEYNGQSSGSPLEEVYVESDNIVSSDNLAETNSIAISSRSDVLRACTVTSGLLAALGLIIRQVSHVASTEGLPILDCSEVSFSFETWHLELITGLVILVSSCRYTLLKIWLDFADSSEVANRQVLTSLQPSDYIVVAVLPGLSEELLFRGALLPLFGINWTSVLVVSSIFGFLHLGGGRKYSFAIWATFVGFLYGYATIASSSIIVPMASHAVNNLVGGFLWRYTSNSSKVDIR